MTPIVLPNPITGLGSGSPLKILQGSGRSVPSGVDGLIVFNKLIMNDRKNLDTIIIEKIDGLGDADIRDERESNPQADGETPFNAFYSGRTIVLSGFVRAFTLDKMRDMLLSIRAAFRPLHEQPMVFRGRDLPSTSQIYCRKFAPLVEEESQTRDDMFRREIMITVRASNPLFLSLFNELVVGEIEGEEIWQGNAINNGNAEAQPIIKLFGPLTGPIVENDNAEDPNKQSLVFKNEATIGSEEVWTIDIAKGTIRDEEGNNKFDQLDPESGWITLVSGNNKIRLFASSTDSNSLISISYKHSWF